MLGKIREAEDALAAVAAEVTEHMVVPRIDELRMAFLEGVVVFPDLGEFEEALEDPRLDRLRFLPQLGLVPVELRPVHPAVVAVLAGIAVVVVVVEHADLVAEIDEGDAAYGENDAVEQQDAAYRHLDLVFVLLVKPFLKPAERGGRSADPGIPGLRVELEHFPAGKTIALAREKPVQEPTVVMRIDLDFPEVAVFEAPADIVVAADVIHP